MNRLRYILAALAVTAGFSARADEPQAIGMHIESDTVQVNVSSLLTDPFAGTEAAADTLPTLTAPAPAAADSTAAPRPRFRDYDDWQESDRAYDPSPTRAVWLSALCPGLGQLYNRRYWKLPIVAGAFMGLGYATSWNSGMLRDYSQAYRDLMDDDPSTRSYMNFFPPTVDEKTLNKDWLKRTFKARKDFYRRNREICVISIVGVYLLAMVDAYVDASLSHFDISPDLSMDVAPALVPDRTAGRAAPALVWAFSF